MLSRINNNTLLGARTRRRERDDMGKKNPDETTTAKGRGPSPSPPPPLSPSLQKNNNNNKKRFCIPRTFSKHSTATTTATSTTNKSTQLSTSCSNDKDEYSYPPSSKEFNLSSCLKNHHQGGGGEEDESDASETSFMEHDDNDPTTTTTTTTTTKGPLKIATQTESVQRIYGRHRAKSMAALKRRKPTLRQKLAFSTVTIHYFPLVLGNSPTVALGPPLALGDCHSEVLEYRETVPVYDPTPQAFWGGRTGPTDRLLIPADVRKRMLLQDGVPPEEIKQSAVIRKVNRRTQQQLMRRYII